MRRNTCLLCRSVLALALASRMFSIGFASDHDDDLVDDTPAAPNGNEQGVMGRSTISGQTIEAWIFGNRFRSGQMRPRQSLETSLKVKVNRIVKASGIGDPQIQKLLLAGEGDIHRFIERVEDFKRTCRADIPNENDVNKIYQETRPLQAIFRKGLFEEGSLFAKALKGTITGEQLARYEEVNRAGRDFGYRARTELLVIQLGDVLGLSDDQRKSLLQLLIANLHAPNYTGTMDYYVVFVQMSRLPDETLRPIFDQRQWLALQRQFATVTKFLPVLNQNGIFLGIDPWAAARNAARLPEKDLGKKPRE
jgi:hypothetical protein